MTLGERGLRVFLGPLEIAGFYSGLEAGLRVLGVKARLVTLGSPHPFGYGQAQSNPRPARVEAAIRRLSLPRPVWMTVVAALRVWTLLWAIPRFDVFVFGFGKSILPGNWDLPILRRLGKVIIVHVGHGAELRPPAMCSLARQTEFTRHEVSRLLASERRRRATARRMEATADVVIAYPLSAQFLKKPFVNSLALGLPSRDSEARHDRRTTIARAGTPVRILHAPSNSPAKGTSEILEVLEVVASTHGGLEVVLLQGVPNRDVLETLREVDLVVDQLWSDTPMAGLATEAASRGVPTLVAGFGWHDLDEIMPRESWPPSFICAPDLLFATIQSLVSDPVKLKDMGARARSFVREIWSEEAVAIRFLRLIRGDVPAEWWVDPNRITYQWGAGCSQEAVTAFRETVGRRTGPCR